MIDDITWGVPVIIVPAEAVFNPKLSSDEKMLFGILFNLAPITNLYGTKITDDQLSNFLNIPTDTIKNGLSNLANLFYIEIKKDKLQNRVLFIDWFYTSRYRSLVEQWHDKYA